MHYRSPRVIRLGGWSPRLPTRFLVSRGILVPACSLKLRVRDYYALWSRFSNRSFHSLLRYKYCRSVTPQNRSFTVWPHPHSLATTNGLSFDFFSWSYLDVSVHFVPHCMLFYSHTADQAFTLAGLPHSDICGSMDICSSPQLIAACHVLHRLLVPRHPPCALSNLTFVIFGSHIVDHPDTL